MSSSQRCIDYDIRVVEDWLTHLRKFRLTTARSKAKAYSNSARHGPRDRHLPSFKGMLKYNACDVNDIMKSTPESFYDDLFTALEDMKGKADINS